MNKSINLSLNLETEGIHFGIKMVVDEVRPSVIFTKIQCALYIFVHNITATPTICVCACLHAGFNHLSATSHTMP